MGLEELKNEVHRLVDETSSEGELISMKQRLTQINRGEPPFVTEEEEKRLDIGMAQIEAGNYLSLEEFERRMAERRALRQG